ncbi:hypothetical protein FRC14_008186 [Serendipita sp. 396]|nr:hypothetical protein FRC14_008186 [Serendipita sp. 396]KAG8776273.1 hypothetical protein FRC15_012019 [Serendipita sp. 397]
MLPPFETEENPSTGRFAGILRWYRPLVDFLEQEGAIGLCMMLALHIISTGLCMFLGGFILTAPLWVVNLVPEGAYPTTAIQLGTVTAYVLVLLVPLPLFRHLRRFPGCHAAIVTLLAWEVLVIRWFCVEDDRTSRMSTFLCLPLVRTLAFLGSAVALVYAGTLAWMSSRSSGSWPPRLWVIAVLGELFVLQEFYRNGV